MSIVTIDQSLEQIEKTYWDRHEAVREVPALLGRVIKEPDKWDWNTGTTTTAEYIKSYTVPEKPVPDDSSLKYRLPHSGIFYHTNYLEYLEIAYALHRPVVITPDILWYQIVSEIAKAVKADPELHRMLYTYSEEKVDIVVDADINNLAAALIKAIRPHMPVNPDKFVVEFSTTSTLSHMANMTAFLESASPYYNYFMLACGIPSVRIDGVAEDWSLIQKSVKSLAYEFECCKSPVADWLSESIAPTLYQIDEARKDPESAGSFFKDMFHSVRCGSGSDRVIDGWFSRKFFMQYPSDLAKLDHFSTGVSYFQFKDLNHSTDHRFYSFLGHSEMVNGFLVPVFDNVVSTILEEPIVRRGR